MEIFVFLKLGSGVFIDLCLNVNDVAGTKCSYKFRIYSSLVECKIYWMQINIFSSNANLLNKIFIELSSNVF